MAMWSICIDRKWGIGFLSSKGWIEKRPAADTVGGPMDQAFQGPGPETAFPGPVVVRLISGKSQVMALFLLGGAI